jgi:hypothetical protein
MNGTVNRHLRLQNSRRAMSNDIYKYKPLLQTHYRDTNEQGEILRSRSSTNDSWAMAQGPEQIIIVRRPKQ